MAAEGGVIVTFIFTGEEERDALGDYIIPQNVTHLLFHESVTVIPEWTFVKHPNIVEVYCHVGVKRIERWAFHLCPRLRRLIIPGVEIIEEGAFDGCVTVTGIECPKLERVGYHAFSSCKSLGNIYLPSAKIVEAGAFWGCKALLDANFGTDLESIGGSAFRDCFSLERITIPLKNGLLTGDRIFQWCRTLKEVDLVEGALRDTVAALHSEAWRNDMNAEVYSINQILSNADPGSFIAEGEKAQAIRDWIARVLRKIIDYKAQHCRLLNGVMASTLGRVLPIPKEIVMNNLLPFLGLPSYKFEGEDEEEDEENNSDDDSENVREGV